MVGAEGSSGLGIAGCSAPLTLQVPCAVRLLSPVSPPQMAPLCARPWGGCESRSQRGSVRVGSLLPRVSETLSTTEVAGHFISVLPSGC